MSDKKCAASDRPQCWKEIDFKKANRRVKKLQRRIYAACSQDDADKVITLINIMLHSFYAKASAVRYVCSTHGRKTPGVDGVLWLTDEERFRAIYSLRLRGYRPKPLKRVYKKKPNGSSRPLGIPSMRDRAVQTLYKFALEPVMEFFSDEHSYGFRQGRNVQGAILYLTTYLSEHPECEWILKSDIDSCFNNISHKWLLNHLPGNTKILRRILKSGVIENGVWHPTNKGVPQGGSVSSILCNLTLDGIEKVCTSMPSDVYIDNPSGIYPDIPAGMNTDVDLNIPICVSRYADDFVVCTDEWDRLVQELIPVIEKFLIKRGLRLSEEKTNVFHIRDGFTFLGWDISKQNGAIMCVPTKRAINSLFEKIQKIVLNEGCFTEKEVKQKFKCLIRGWLNFYSIATEPYLRGLEFDLVMFLSRLTGSQYLVDYIKNEFVKIFK